MNMIKINEQISFLRHQKGITQEALARLLGVTNQTISKWESGQCCPDIQFLPQIADYFGAGLVYTQGKYYLVKDTGPRKQFKEWKEIKPRKRRKQVTE